MTTQNQTIRKILIAPDKFKGSLTSLQAANAIKRGIEAACHLPCSPVSCVSGMHQGTDNSLQSGNISGGICAANGETSQLGNNLGGVCGADGDIVLPGNNLGGICDVNGENPVAQLQFRIVEIADGGDGSLEVLQKKIPGASIADITVHDPLGMEVASGIMLYRMPRAEKDTLSSAEKENVAACAENGAKMRLDGSENEFCAENGAEMRPDGGRDEFCAENGGDLRAEEGELCAFIEMAKISGLEMLAKGDRNPLRTSTYGMGEAIKAAIAQGATQITLSIGGSATNDGGAGMLQALGYSFFDAAGEQMPAPICGGDLQRVAAVVAPGDKLQGVEFKVICDVTNPLLGETGATAVYGPQKGADAQALVQLEAGLANYALVTEKCFGVAPQMKEYPGAGAAGGVGYAGLVFLGAELVPGWKFFAGITSLEESVRWADLVITGEGSLDSQSLSGKVVSGVINLAAKYNKEVAVFCGVSKLSPEEMEAVAKLLPKGARCYSIASLGYPLEVCMRDAANLLQQLAFENILCH